MSAPEEFRDIPTESLGAGLERIAAWFAPYANTGCALTGEAAGQVTQALCTLAAVARLQERELWQWRALGRPAAGGRQ
jgi:hypothetical protein